MAVCVATSTPTPAMPARTATLERPISESPGSFFPQVSINTAKAFSQKRIRSFGDLQLLSDSDGPAGRYVCPPLLPLAEICCL